MNSLTFGCWATVAALAGIGAAAADAEPDLALDRLPEGYRLHVYDDCGVEGRQPHVQMADSYCWTFATSDTDADLPARSAVFSYKSVNVRYDDLDPQLPYVVAVTYASDHVYSRVQSLWANDLPVHGPLPLAKAKAERLLYRLPAAATAGGKLHLQIRIHGEVNATLSVVELWAPDRPRQGLRIVEVSGLYADLAGRVTDLAYEGVAGATVVLRRVGAVEPLGSTTSGTDGRFAFARRLVSGLPGTPDLRLSASREGDEVGLDVPAAELSFEPVRYRPLPTAVAGLGTVRVSLDGAWRLHPDPGPGVREASTDGPGWGAFRVPGQWLQQGYDVPPERAVAVSRQLDIPAAWAGYRVFLRFDAIHAGTRYWLNGQYLGTSEVLFTPVEWEVTRYARFGEANRLDLEMTVATGSERLAHASGYAFHNLGGIDRAVSLFALPPVHVRALRVTAGLDAACRDGELALEAEIDNPQDRPVEGLALEVDLTAQDGAAVRLATARQEIGPAAPGGTTVRLVTPVPAPAPWSAEAPNLYRLTVSLRQGQEPRQTIERSIGFRRVEVRGRQLYLNGRVIKLAGACRHEIDPLTGRADTARHAEGDVRLLKGASLNYARTAHYPPTAEFLEATDRLGLYVEVEAPFCWVAPTAEMDDLARILTPVSAMVDACHSHPSVILWSIANESAFNRTFEVATRLCRDLDPTRPTTFNNPDPGRVCSIANLHYPSAPYDEQIPDDPRPVLLGEYFFPVCHEQTDVRIDPGLRELWGLGHSAPDSDWGRRAAQAFASPRLGPGTPPGTWTAIRRSERLVGGAIWAAFDEPFYLPGGKHAGYAWHHGFWGLIDAWRRPKPEWWLSKLIFSPVWFPVRQLDLPAAPAPLRLPVENRYTFTDLRELAFSWTLGDHGGRLAVQLPPASSGHLEVPLPAGTPAGADLLVEARNRDGDLVTAAVVRLGQRPPATLPRAKAGAPACREEGDTVAIAGDAFGLVLNRTTGRFATSDPRHTAPLLEFPAVHATRFDFGDLAGPNALPYEVLPKPETHTVEAVTVQAVPGALQLRVRDRYDGWTGTVTWTLDRRGVGTVACEYVYAGAEFQAREIGVRFLLPADCDDLQWERWSEWGSYPADSISRTAGGARARRDPALGTAAEDTPPRWPWSLDETELGTNDFRSVKLNVYQAAVRSPGGRGLRLQADADAHVRTCLDPRGVAFHALSTCGLAPTTVRPGDTLRAAFTVVLVRDAADGAR